MWPVQREPDDRPVLGVGEVLVSARDVMRRRSGCNGWRFPDVVHPRTSPDIDMELVISINFQKCQLLVGRAFKDVMDCGAWKRQSRRSRSRGVARSFASCGT